jgi:hypothetical protein
MFHWQLHKCPPISISLWHQVPNHASVEYLAVVMCTRRRWPVLAMSSTRASSLMLPEHILRTNLFSLPLIRVFLRQQGSKISGELILVYMSRSHSIQWLKINQWPTRATVLARIWTEATWNGRSTWAVSMMTFPATMQHSGSYGVVAFN